MASSVIGLIRVVQRDWSWHRVLQGLHEPIFEEKQPSLREGSRVEAFTLSDSMIADRAFGLETAASETGRLHPTPTP